MSPRLFSARALRLSVAILTVSALPLSALLSGCSRASATALPSAQQVAEARQSIDMIPPPSKSRYMAVHSLTSWENPYLTVQANMATLHVLAADANPSQIGSGGLLRPVGARRQDIVIRLSDLPEALDAVPESSWPYGRVIALEEAHNTPASDEPAVRRNVENTVRTLNDLGVVVYDWTESTPR